MNKALALAPKNWAALKASADFQFQQGHYLDVPKMYTKLLQQKFDDLETLLALGVCYFAQKETKETKTRRSGLMKVF